MYPETSEQATDGNAALHSVALTGVGSNGGQDERPLAERLERFAGFHRVSPEHVAQVRRPVPWLSSGTIDWVIVGGESGPRARAMDPRWARDIRDQCCGAGVAFFFKQWGGKNKKKAGRILDGRTWDDMPDIPGAALSVARVRMLPVAG